MILFETPEVLNQYITLRTLLDIEHLAPYEEVALRRKIYPYIPESVVMDLKKSEVHRAIFHLLRKAVAHYTLPIAVPFLKVILSNTGANNARDGKMMRSAWWDVRDMALMSAQIADEALTDCMEALMKTAYRPKLKFLQTSEQNPFKSPNDFFGLLKIKGGWEVFNTLGPFIEHIWVSIIKDQIKDCALAEIMAEDTLSQWLKRAMAYYAMGDASESEAFAFTGSGIFIKWEQLPWQKSEVLSPMQLANYKNRMYAKGNHFMQLLLKYLKEHKAAFPCFQSAEDDNRKVMVAKSGLYF